VPARSKGALPRIMSVLNTLGGTLFFVAYMVDFNKYAGEHRDVSTWLVATPFTVGSISFLIASWMSLWMWKAQQFGLGFSTVLDEKFDTHGEDDVKVNLKQQVMILIYTGNIVIQIVLLGFIWSLYYDIEHVSLRRSMEFDAAFKLLGYHTIMFLASVVHKTPAGAPYNYLVRPLGLLCI